MATQMTVVYNVAYSPAISEANALTQTGAVALPTGDLANLAVTLTSDNTATSVIPFTVTRTLVFSLVPVMREFEPFSTVTFRVPTLGGSLVSSAVGTDQVIQINEGSNVGGATGKTVARVPLVGAEFTNLPETVSLANDDFDFTSPFAPAPVGIIQLFSGPNLQGDLIGYLNPGGTTGYQASIFSTDENDISGGAGARTITIHYDDTAGAPQTEVVTMNGTTPVNTVATNIRLVTNMVVTTAGAVSQNVGVVTVTNAPNGKGGLAGRLPASFFSYFNPATSDIRGPFFNLYTYILGNILSTTVTALTPVAA